MSRRWNKKPKTRRPITSRRGLAHRRLHLEVLEGRYLLSGSSTSPLAQYPLLPFEPTGGPLTGSSTASGYTPTQMQDAYEINQITFGGGTIQGNGAGETIAIVDAYDAPTINSDLAAFDTHFGLAAPPSFSVVSQTGSTTLPGTDPTGPGTGNSWAAEQSLDVEWSHALAPDANILLVETNSSSYSDLFTGVNYARNQPGVVVVSMSWGSAEFSSESTYDTDMTTPAGHAGVTFLASTGDGGEPGEYPAYSPNVLAVGGTTLNLSGSTYGSESAWSGSGGGVSQYESQPGFQNGVVSAFSTTQRTIPDVSFDANPSTGIPVYDTWDNSATTPWEQFGGTSLSSPSWAALIAIADQGRATLGLTSLDGPSQTLPRLYEAPYGIFHDVTTGSNGFSAGVGYDLATGLGSPIAPLVVDALMPDPTITVSEAGRSIADGESSPSTTNGTDFGLTTIAGATETFTITNVGTAALNLTGKPIVQISGGDASDFTVITQPGTTSLAVNGTATFQVKFVPAAAGLRTAKISISNNDPIQTNPFTFAIQGTEQNLAPTVAVPATQSVSENTSLTFSSGANDAISMADLDSDGGIEQLQMSVTAGTLSVPNTSNVTITAGANNSSTLTLQGTVANLDTAINGLVFHAPTLAQSVTLTVTADDLGNTGVGGALTTTQTLTINVTSGLAAPVVTTNPTNQSVTPGSTVTFTAAASGNPTPTVQWQVSTNGGATFTNLTGYTSNNLTFAAPALANGYQVQAVFTNSHGAATTSAATLTVAAAAAPVVTTNPASQSVTAGSTVTFTAAASGNPTPTVQWQVSTNGGSTFTNITGATATTYSFTTTAAQTGYKYQAVFTNSQGTATTSAATLTVTAALAAPVVTLNPTSQSVSAGSTVTFTAAASGNPAPTVQWQVSSNGGSTFTNITGATSTAYSFTTSTTQSGNEYRAVFTNSQGTATTSAATLTATVPLTAPVVTLNPTNQSVSVGSTVTFTVAASGNPTPTVQWQVSTDGGVTFTNLTGYTSTTLTFTAPAVANGYQVRAVFTNSQGTATTSAATLTVTGA